MKNHLRISKQGTKLWQMSEFQGRLALEVGVEPFLMLCDRRTRDNRQNLKEREVPSRHKGLDL